MADQFKAGDTVRLKSGGPKMTVASVGKKYGSIPRVLCEWFKDDVKNKAEFAPESLEYAE